MTYHWCDELSLVVAVDRIKEEGVAVSAADCQSKTHRWLTEMSLIKSSLSISPDPKHHCFSLSERQTTLKSFRGGNLFSHSQLTAKRFKFSIFCSLFANISNSLPVC